MNDLEQKYADFVSTLSHELRTPLTSIKGFAQTLLMAGDKLDEKQKEKFLIIIKEQADRLIKMVENLLALSRLENNNTLLVFKQTNVDNLLEQTIQIVKSQYPKHIFNYDKRNNLPLVYTDADKLQQVMVNLIENAAKYSDEGKNVIVKPEIKEQFLSIKVIDEGIGIAKEDLEKIFKKFSRLDTPLTRKTQGSGIGLYITKTLIEKLHGSISVDSSANGSTFEVKIPLVDPEQQIQDKLKENENAG